MLSLRGKAFLDTRKNSRCLCPRLRSRRSDVRLGQCRFVLSARRRLVCSETARRPACADRWKPQRENNQSCVRSRDLVQTNFLGSVFDFHFLFSESTSMNDFLTRLIVAAAITLAALLLSSSSQAADTMRAPHRVQTRIDYRISLIARLHYASSNGIRIFLRPSL